MSNYFLRKMSKECLFKSLRRFSALPACRTLNSDAALGSNGCESCTRSCERSDISVGHLRKENNCWVKIESATFEQHFCTAFVLDVLLKTIAPFIIAAAGFAVPRLVFIVLVNYIFLLEAFEEFLCWHNFRTISGRVPASIHCDVRNFLDHKLCLWWRHGFFMLWLDLSELGKIARWFRLNRDDLLHSDGDQLRGLLWFDDLSEWRHNSECWWFRLDLLKLSFRLNSWTILWRIHCDLWRGFRCVPDRNILNNLILIILLFLLNFS